MTPVPVAGGLTFARIVAGQQTTCGITTAQAAYCWGSNGAGRLGIGSTVDRNVPTAVSGGLSFVDIDTRFSHVCGVTTGGSAYCWGANYNRQLGVGSTGDFLTTPTLVQGAVTFASVRAGEISTCGRTSAGAVSCWGGSGYGGLGNGTFWYRHQPVRVAAP
jgi:alpha-tubulin suppressor-like RCC1 family protein